jgi:hypothetical protein
MGAGDDKKVGAVPGPPVITTPPFPSAYADPLVKDDKLDQALMKAIDAGPGRKWRVGIAMVALDEKKVGAQPMAHFKGDREFFGASMIKVAALYALCELRTTLRAIAKELGTNTSKSELIKDCSRYMNKKILANLGNLPQLSGAARNQVLPQLDKAFKAVDAAGGTFSVDFHDDFAPEPSTPTTPEPIGYIEEMIVKSVNQSAGRCVQANGYGYLNGALASAGFFEPRSSKGVWLAGDYIDPRYDHDVTPYTMIRIDSDNDQGVAQASTALHLVRMMVLLNDGVLFNDADARAVMIRVMAKAAHYPEVWIDRDISPIPFKVLLNKLGVADLKPRNDGGANVYSECSLIRHDSGRKFAAVWLNYLVGKGGFDVIGQVVRDTMDEYVKS